MGGGDVGTTNNTDAGYESDQFVPETIDSKTKELMNSNDFRQQVEKRKSEFGDNFQNIKEIKSLEYSGMTNNTTINFAMKNESSLELKVIGDYSELSGHLPSLLEALQKTK